MEVDGTRQRGRLRKTWWNNVKDMKSYRPRNKWKTSRGQPANNIKTVCVYILYISLTDLNQRVGNTCRVAASVL